jgi:hypothetical protein
MPLSLDRRLAAASAILQVSWLFSVGCASHHHRTTLSKQTIQIVSQPAGAKIEMNGRYMGDAPTTVEVDSSPNGRFWRDTIFKAYPKDTGYIQIKAFNGESNWAISDPVPPRIAFDTRTDPLKGTNQPESQ